MARPKTYDREEAIRNACEAFWEHGYQALGVRELETLTGLSKTAIRSEFGGKEGLYLEALALYSDAAISSVLAPLKEGGMSQIIDFLEGLVDQGSITSSPWGCLVVNTGIENARIQSDKLHAATQSYWDALESHFAQALDNACARHEIAPDTDTAALAKGLVTAVMGVHAKNRSARAQTGGHALVALMVTYLDSLRTV